MIFFLTSQPLWLSGVILVGLTTVVSMFGPPIVRRYIGLERLTTNNEVAGFKFATVGVLYAVFLAFAIILVWQKYSDADATVGKEAGAAASIYHLSQGIEGTPGMVLRARLTDYLKIVISDEWPAMAHGGASKPARQALEAVYAALLAANNSQQQLHDSALMSEIFYQVDLLTQARRDRLLAAEGFVPGIVWIVLFGGATLTIAFTLFFGNRSLRAQTLMTGLLSILIFSELLIVVAIDHPFTGHVKVGPEPLSEVLGDLGY
jgi:hypothetical protein